MSKLCLYVLFLLFLYIPTKEAVHMYQQNRYQMERYRTWLKNTLYIQKLFIVKIGIAFLPLCAICFIPKDHHPISLLMILMLIYIYMLLKWDQEHAYIQKLKFTHRVRRLLAMMYLIYTLIFLLLQVFPVSVFALLLPFLFLSPWCLLILGGSLMYPIEMGIRESYVKEAKQILVERDHLIKVGITGSYGKTSVKNILHALLSEKYYAFMTPHSYNNLMGLTISIRTMLKPLHQVFIAEMGADHVGEIETLANFIHPSMAIITAVGPQHLETFGTQDHILQEKMQLVEHLPFHGIAILNYDNELIRSYTIQQNCKSITYGIHHEDVDYRAIDIQYSPKGSAFTIVHEQEQLRVETCLLGEHNVLNILAAYCAAKVLEVSDQAIMEALKRLRYVEHRLEVRKMGMYTLLDDAYNSNPQGAAYALDVLKQMPGTRYLMTPGFLDLGAMKKAAHQQYAKEMMKACDIIILIGPTQTRDIYETLLQEGYPIEHLFVKASTKDAFALLHTMVKKGDTVLIENDLPDAFNH